MLADSPWAFAASESDDAGLNADGVAASLARPGYAIAAAVLTGGTLAAAAGVAVPRHIKMAHRAHIWGVYVTPPERRRGLGEQVVRLAVETARQMPGVTSAGLSVSARTPSARRLYERLGFRAWGLEPGALVINGQAFDEVHMVLMFS